MIILGIDFKNKIIKSRQDDIRLQIWDTAGQDRYKAVTNQFYKGVHGIIIAYDITNTESFKNVRDWLSQIEQNASPNIVKVLVGNKCDLERERRVSTENGKKLADEFNMEFFETSAAKDIMITEVFETMTQALMESVKTNKASTRGEKEEDFNSSENEEDLIRSEKKRNVIVLNNKNTEKKGCCCSSKPKVNKNVKDSQTIAV